MGWSTCHQLIVPDRTFFDPGNPARRIAAGMDAGGAAIADPFVNADLLVLIF
jgi:hypothetical protein